MSDRVLIFHPECYKELKKLDGTQREWALKVLSRLKDSSLQIQKVLAPMGDRNGIKLSGTYKAKNRATGMRMVVREVHSGEALLNVMYDEKGQKVSVDRSGEDRLYIQSLAVGQKEDTKKIYKAASKRYYSLKKNDC